MNRQEIYNDIIQNYDVKRILPSVTVYRKNAVILALWNDNTIETWGRADCLNTMTLEQAIRNFESMCNRWSI